MAFPEDKRNCEVLIFQDIKHYKEKILEYRKGGNQCKVLLFLDYIRNLNRINGIQILKELPDSFCTYVKEKCTFGVPIIRVEKDNCVLDKIESSIKETFFTTVIYPLIYNGIKESGMKKEIIKAIVKTIKELVTRDSCTIEKYQAYIKPKYYKLFVKWLKTPEALQVCECLLDKTIKYEFDSFEINYLLNYTEE